MARKKIEEKMGAGNRSGWSSFIHFMARGPVWQTLLFVVAVVVIVLQWGNITAWYKDTVYRLFGWGVLLLLAVIITVLTLIWTQQLRLLAAWWNRWLAGCVFVLFLWGILAFIPGNNPATAGIGQGGEFGKAVISRVDMPGVFRLIGLFILGIILFFPRGTWRLTAGLSSGIARQMKRPGYKPLKQKDVVPQHPAQLTGSLPSVAAPKRSLIRRNISPGEDELPEVNALKILSKGKNVPALKPAEPPAEEKEEKDEDTPRDLKQVAQDVWKKYGESPDLVVVDGWKLPPIEILDVTPEIPFSQADNAEKARLIEDALASYGVDSKVVQINAGPTVTQFGVEPGWDRKTKEVKEKDKDGNVKIRVEEVSRTRVKVERINSLQNDLALALAAPSIRIEAPVPGKAIVGIEVPNTSSSMVSLRGVIETNTFQKLQNKSRLALALGKGAGGEAVVGDLSRMPHLLIAGATGSGKTVCLNAIICCLLLSNSPNDVRFVMIDPKRVELTMFRGIPHLAAPVIVESDKALEALRWLAREMNSRYQVLAAAGSRNIDGYNKNRQGADQMPYLVLVIDELADLMMTGGDEVEQILCRLAQLARAVGIHLVVATQRPSVDVITGLIKANFPTRISFAVTSLVDSRTILDIGGAEKLMGSGDMLFLPTDASKPKRLQGCYVSDSEAERLVYFWSSQKKEEIIPLLKLDELMLASAKKDEFSGDSLMDAARDLARNHDNVSTSFLQRRLHIGYPRAARIMEDLEKEMQDWDRDDEIDLDDLDET